MSCAACNLLSVSRVMLCKGLEGGGATYCAWKSSMPDKEESSRGSDAKNHPSTATIRAHSASDCPILLVTQLIDLCKPKLYLSLSLALLHPPQRSVRVLHRLRVELERQLQSSSLQKPTAIFKTLHEHMLPKSSSMLQVNKSLATQKVHHCYKIGSGRIQERPHTNAQRGFFITLHPSEAHVICRKETTILLEILIRILHQA